METDDARHGPGSQARPLARVIPRTLFARVALIIVLGLAIAQAMTFAAIRYERGMAMRNMMLSGVERDIATAVAILDRLPASERAGWLRRLEQPNYRFTLGDEAQGAPLESAPLQQLAHAIERAVRPYAVTGVVQAPGSRNGMDIALRLSDGTPLLVHARRVELPVSGWVVWLLAVQLAVLVACAWLAVRIATRPLARLAAAANALGPQLRAERLPEDGPSEVAHAARAFNAMQDRIAGQMAERIRILAAISHDLQTPITRMRLRTDLLDNAEAREKFRQDLAAMHELVREGVAYARTLHAPSEPARRIDLDALLESMVADYGDSGADVALEGRAGHALTTRPQALRRILANLIDNALKFGGSALVRVHRDAGSLRISVMDCGPGIPADELEAVLQPFYRVEASRSRESGGTGLGLAIANELATAIGARLFLRNRDEGGLDATLAIDLGRTDRQL